MKHSSLEAIARSHGRPGSAVRVAVNRGLIHKARRKGVPGARGKGHEWLYPPGTDRALKTLFKLQEQGYQGNALRFQLWWDGTAPFSKAIPKYIADTLNAPRKDILAQLKRKGVRAPLTRHAGDTFEEGPYEGTREGDRDDEADIFFETVATRLDDALKTNLFHFFLESLKRIGFP